MGIGSRKDPGFQAALNASLRRRLDGTGNLLRPGEQMRLFNTWKRVRSNVPVAWCLLRSPRPGLTNVLTCATGTCCAASACHRERSSPGFTFQPCRSSILVRWILKSSVKHDRLRYDL